MSAGRMTLFKTPNYEFSILLDGQQFLIAVEFNRILDRYVMRMFDNDRNEIFASRTMVLGTDLFRGTSSQLRNQIAFLFDKSGTGTELSIDNANEIVFLNHVDSVI